jgi:hypothetical protein
MARLRLEAGFALSRRASSFDGLRIRWIEKTLIEFENDPQKAL